MEMSIFSNGQTQQHPQCASLHVPVIDHLPIHKTATPALAKESVVPRALRYSFRIENRAAMSHGFQRHCEYQESQDHNEGIGGTVLIRSNMSVSFRTETPADLRKRRVRGQDDGRVVEESLLSSSFCVSAKA